MNGIKMNKFFEIYIYLRFVKLESKLYLEPSLKLNTAQIRAELLAKENQPRKPKQNTAQLRKKSQCKYSTDQSRASN